MSEEDTVRAPDQVDGKMEGDALIHPAAEKAVEVEAPAEASVEEKPAEDVSKEVPADEKVNE